MEQQTNGQGGEESPKLAQLLDLLPWMNKCLDRSALGDAQRDAAATAIHKTLCVLFRSLFSSRFKAQWDTVVLHTLSFVRLCDQRLPEAFSRDRGDPTSLGGVTGSLVYCVALPEAHEVHSHVVDTLHSHYSAMASRDRGSWLRCVGSMVEVLRACMQLLLYHKMDNDGQCNISFTFDPATTPSALHVFQRTLAVPGVKHCVSLCCGVTRMLTKCVESHSSFLGAVGQQMWDVLMKQVVLGPPDLKRYSFDCLSALLHHAPLPCGMGDELVICLLNQLLCDSQSDNECCRTSFVDTSIAHFIAALLTRISRDSVTAFAPQLADVVVQNVKHTTGELRLQLLHLLSACMRNNSGTVAHAKHVFDLVGDPHAREAVIECLSVHLTSVCNTNETASAYSYRRSPRKLTYDAETAMGSQSTPPMSQEGRGEPLCYRTLVSKCEALHDDIPSSARDWKEPICTLETALSVLLPLRDRLKLDLVYTRLRVWIKKAHSLRSRASHLAQMALLLRPVVLVMQCVSPQAHLSLRAILLSFVTYEWWNVNGSALTDAHRKHVCFLTRHCLTQLCALEVDECILQLFYGAIEQSQYTPIRCHAIRLLPRLLFPIHSSNKAHTTALTKITQLLARITHTSNDARVRHEAASMLGPLVCLSDGDVVSCDEAPFGHVNTDTESCVNTSVLAEEADEGNDERVLLLRLEEEEVYQEEDEDPRVPQRPHWACNVCRGHEGSSAAHRLRAMRNELSWNDVAHLLHNASRNSEPDRPPAAPALSAVAHSWKCLLAHSSEERLEADLEFYVSWVPNALCNVKRPKVAHYVARSMGPLGRSRKVAHELLLALNNVFRQHRDDEVAMQQLLVAYASLGSWVTSEEHLSCIIQQLVGSMVVEHLCVRSTAYEQMAALSQRLGLSNLGELLERYCSIIYPFVLRHTSDDPALVEEVADIFDKEGRSFVRQGLRYALPSMVCQEERASLGAVAQVLGEPLEGLLMAHLEYVLVPCMLGTDRESTTGLQLLHEYLPQLQTDMAIVAYGGLRLAQQLALRLPEGEPVATKVKRGLIVIQRAMAKHPNRQGGHVAMKAPDLSHGLDVLVADFLACEFFRYLDLLNTMFLSPNDHRQHVKALHTLRELIRCLEPPVFSKTGHRGKYLKPLQPNILGTLRLALEVPRRRSEALDVWITFVQLMEITSLGPHLGQIVVDLLPYVDGGEASDPGVSAKVVRLLGMLTLEHRDDPNMSEYFAQVHFLPDIPALHEIRAALLPKQQAAEASLQQVCSGLKQKSVRVRKMALKRLVQVWEEHGAELEREIASSPKLGSVMCDLLDLLLRGRAKDPRDEGELRVMYARCLGLVGAVDPGRVHLKQVEELPLRLSPVALATRLISDVLVPALCSARSMGDQALVSMCIQDLLRSFGCDQHTPSAAHADAQAHALAHADAAGSRKGRRRSSNGAEREAAAAARGRTAATKLWLGLRAADCELVRPFLTSQFIPKRKETSGGALSLSRLSRCSTFKGWIGTFTKVMIVEHVAWCTPGGAPPPNSTYAAVFHACARMVVKEVQLAQLLLPYVTFEVLQQRDDATVSAVSAEWKNVLQSKSTEASVMRTQVVFNVLDVVRSWAKQAHFELNKRFRGKSRSGRRPSHKSARRSKGPVVPTEEERALQTRLFRVLKVLDDIPQQVLATAALRCDAHARALMHLENHYRDAIAQAEHAYADHVNTMWEESRTLPPELLGSRKRPRSKDKSFAAVLWIPRPSPKRIEVLQSAASLLQRVYSGIDEPDGLEGIAALRSEPTLEERLCDYEQDGRWGEALTLYDRALQAEDGSRPESRCRLVWLRCGRMRCLLRQGNVETLLTLARGLGLFLGLTGAPVVGMGPVSSMLSLSTSTSQSGGAASPATPSAFTRAGSSCSVAAVAAAAATLPVPRRDAGMEGVPSGAPDDAYLAMWEFEQRAYVMQAAWRLGQWEPMRHLLHGADDAARQGGHGPAGGADADDGGHGRLRQARTCGFDGFLAAALLALHDRDVAAMRQALTAARTQVMGPLAAAAMESYQRAYPHLVQLALLAEVEQVAACVCPEGATPAPCDAEALERRWEARLRAMQPSFRVTESLLHCRRVLRSLVPGADRASWISIAKAARHEGQLQVAFGALANAPPSPALHMERAKLWWAEGKAHDAICELNKGLAMVHRRVAEAEAARGKGHVKGAQSRQLANLNRWTARLRLLLGRWTHHIGHSSASSIAKHFEAVQRMQGDWADGYFYAARYADHLLTAAEDTKDTALWRAALHSLTRAMENYRQTLCRGHKHVSHALPRLLTLWFKYGQLLGDPSTFRESQQPKHSRGRRSSSSSRSRSSMGSVVVDAPNPQQVVKEVNHIMEEARREVPTHVWYVAMAQLCSRITHPEQDVWNLLRALLTDVTVDHPQRAMWHLLPLRFRHNDRLRQERVAHVLEEAEAADKRMGELWEAYATFAQALIQISEYSECGERNQECQLSVGTNFRGLRELFSETTKSKLRRVPRKPLPVLLPTLAFLSVRQPGRAKGAGKGAQVAQGDPFGHCVSPVAVFDKVTAMASLIKPKRITFRGSDGEDYTFLCKPKDDLRRDTRFLEFATLLNQLLSAHPESRRRNLSVQTYAVTPLNERSGLIEWVNNVRPFKRLCESIHGGPIRYPESDWKKREPPQNLRHALVHFPPVLHKWFLQEFREPSKWMDARVAFTRSAAVMSMLGNAMGLGDRHGENILVNEKSGAIMHVDFNCLFWRGQRLTIPERVPFRLTSNMVDAMGLCGYEGIFRRVSERVLSVMRTNCEALCMLLETFLHDPLVDWTERSKSSNSRAKGAAPDIALASLKRVKDQLQGRMDQSSIPMSVKGQVHQLIEEATSEINLGSMYIGWAAFL